MEKSFPKQPAAGPSLQQQPDPPGGGGGPVVTATCGNCCNGMKHPEPTRALQGVVICTALPPSVITVGPRENPRAQNVYPEMDPAKLGCTVFWGVQFSLLHLVGRFAAFGLELEEGPPDDTPPPGS